MKMKSLYLPFVICLMLIASILSCRTATPEQNIILEKGVNVPPDGNTAEVVFQAKEKQRIRISLETKESQLEPYGYLTYPDGNGDYLPKLENAQAGKNSGEITLPQTGDYTLAIMDGTNLGGRVEIKVEILK